VFAGAAFVAADAVPPPSENVPSPSSSVAASKAPAAIADAAIDLRASIPNPLLSLSRQRRHAV
jgi:hypothetical protein